MPSPAAPFAPGSHLIAAHGHGGFAFAGMIHRGSILATPAGVRPLDASAIGDLDPQALAPLVAELADRPRSVEFLVVGTGERLAPPPPGLRAALREAGLRFETMATGPALRVYNVMQSEGRRVAAILIATP
jgi:uncharacterized protein